MKIGKPRGDNHKLVLAGLQASQRNFIELLAACSSEDLCLHLESFTQWVWEKSDILCWAPVLNRFDDIFSSYLDSYRGYVKGEHESVTTFYNKESLRLVCNALKASVMIVENCTSKSIYNSLELLVSFLDDVHPEIVFQATKLLCVYFSRQRKQTTPKDVPEVSVRISILSQTPLADSTCHIYLTKPPPAAPSSEHDVYDSDGSESSENLSYSDVLEFYVRKNEYFLSVDSYIEIGQEVVRGSDSSKLRIPVPDVLNLQSDVGAGKAAEYPKTTEGNKKFAAAVSAWKSNFSTPLDIYKHVVKSMRYLIRKYKVEDCYFAELKHKVCKVFSLYFPFWQRKAVEIRICALICMLIVKNSSYAQFLNYNPSFLLELTHMIKRHRELDRSTMVIVTELLSAMVHDGIHGKTLANLLGLNTAHGIFSKVLRHYLCHIHDKAPLPPLLCFKPPVETKQFPTTNQLWAHHHPTGVHVMTEECVTNLQLRGSVVLGELYLSEWDYRLRLDTEEDRANVQDKEDSMRILLQLLVVFYTFISSHGCSNALTNTSVLEGVAHFVRNPDPIYLPVVIYVVQVLEALLDYNQHVSRTLRNDLKVFHIFVSRMQFDMYQIKHFAPFENPVAEATPWPKGWKMPQTKDVVTLRSYWMSMCDMSARRFLLKTLIHNVDAASRSVVGRNDTIDHDLFAATGAIIPMLHMVFARPLTYGLSVYSSAINLISDALSEDPLLQEELHTMDIIPAMMRSICSDNLKSEDCLNVVPNVICDVLLHRSGREYMKKVNYTPILKLVDIITQKDFVLFDRFGEVASTIGMSLDSIVKNNESSNAVILDRIIKVMYELLQEALTFPPFNPQDSVQCAKDFEAYMHEFRTHSVEITAEILSSLDSIERHDFFADRIAHLGKCLSTYLRSGQTVSHFVSCDGLKLLYQLCTVPCLPPLSALIYSQHPLALLLKSILTHAPVPCISYLHGLCRPYVKQPVRCCMPRTDEEVTRNLEYLRMFHAISYTMYLIYRNGQNMYEACCSGRFQMGATTLSRCDMHMTLSAYLKNVITALPYLTKQFFLTTNEGDLETFFILSGKHTPHEHPQLKAYKILNRDSKNAQTSESSFSANDLFWSSQFAYSYSSHNPAYNNSPSPNLSDDKFKMNIEVCRLCLVTCKAFVYAINPIIDKALKSSNLKNTCLRNFIANHTVSLTLLCINMLNSAPSLVNIASGSGLLIEGMDCVNTARFVAETMEVTYKLFVDDRNVGSIYMLPFAIFCEMNGMMYLKDAFEYMITMYLGCALAFALRVHAGLTPADVLGANFRGNEKQLMTVVDLVKTFDLKKLKHAMGLFGRSLQICLGFFAKICYARPETNTSHITALKNFLATPAFEKVIRRDVRPLSELMTAAATMAGSVCWEWLQVIGSVSSNAPSNGTASLYFYISTKLLTSLLKVQVNMWDYLSPPRQKELRTKLDRSKTPRDGEDQDSDSAGGAVPLTPRCAGRHHCFVQDVAIDGETDAAPSSTFTSEAARSILLEMGFSESEIVRAVTETGRNDVTSLADWLVNHPYSQSPHPRDSDRNAITIDTSTDIPTGTENLTGHKLAVRSMPMFYFECEDTSDDDLWTFVHFERHSTFTSPDPNQVKNDFATKFIDTLLFLSTKMSSSLCTIFEYMVRALATPVPLMINGKYASSTGGFNQESISVLLQHICNCLDTLFNRLSATNFPLDRDGIASVFCPVFFYDELAKGAAIDATVLAGKPAVDAAYNSDIVQLHEQLLGMFYILAQLIGKRVSIGSEFLNDVNNPMDVILNMVEYFQKLRYDAHSSGLLTFAGIGMKPSLSGIPLSLPEWCLHNEVPRGQGNESKSNGRYKIDYVIIKNGFLRNSPDPQMSSPPPFFKYALACISEMLRRHPLIGFYNLMSSSIDLSKNVELLSATKSTPFMSKSSQKKLVRTCLNILECFPGLDGDVTFSVLSILEALTEIYSNVRELLHYKRLPPQENYPAHFNRKLDFEDVIGADAASILLMIPKSARCKGMLKLIAKILLHCMENSSMLRSAIEKRVLQLLSANGCEPVALSTLVDEVAPFAKKDPAMLLEILQKQCVMTLEEGATDVDLSNARVTLQHASRISELLESNRDLMTPGNIPVLESSNKDHTAVADYDVLLRNFLRILVVHMQIFCNIQGLTRPSSTSGDSSKPAYPLALTIHGLFYLLNSFCHNFPIAANSTRLPKAEYDLPYKPFPWKVNMIDVKDSHLVLIQMFRRVLPMICALSAPSPKGHSTKESNQDIASANKLVMTTMSGFLNSIVFICSTSMKMCVSVVEEIKMVLQFLVGLSARDYSTNPFAVALYTVCDVLHNVLQLRFGDGARADLSADSVFQINKSLVSILNKLDLNTEDSSTLCGGIIRALVLLTAPEKNAALAVGSPDKEDDEYSYQDEDDMEVIEVSSSSSELDDMQLESQEDMSETDSEELEEYMEDAMDEDVATDSSGADSDGSDGDSDDESQYDSESDNSDDSSDSGDLDTEDGSVNNDDVDMALPHQVDENYTEIPSSDSESHSSMDEVDEDEDDDDAPRIRVVGELDESHEETITGVMDDTRPHLNIAEDDNNELTSGYSSSSDEGGNDNGAPMMPEPSTTANAGNNVSINITDPSATLPVAGNSSIRIQIEFGGQGDVHYVDPTRAQPHTTQHRVARVARAAPEATSNDAGSTDRSDTWAFSGDLAVPARHPMLTSTRKSSAGATDPDSALINLIAMGLPRIQLPKSPSVDSAEASIEQQPEAMEVDEAPSEEITGSVSVCSGHNDVAEEDPLPSSDSTDLRLVYVNHGLERIAAALRIRYGDLFVLANMDPSVLAELPEEMRDEIIQQQLHTIDADALEALRQSHPLPDIPQSVPPARNEDMPYIEALPRVLRLQVMRSMYGATTSRSDPSHSSRLQTMDSSILSALVPALRSQLFAGSSHEFFESLAPELVGTRFGHHHVHIAGNDADGVAADGSAGVRALLSGGTESSEHARGGANPQQLPGLTFGLIIGEFRDGNNPRVRNTAGQRGRNTVGSRRMGPTPFRRRMDTNTRGMNLNNIVMHGDRVPRVTRSVVNAMDALGAAAHGATDRAAAAASALEPIIINDRGRNGIDTRILQTIPQLFNTLNPQVLNMLHTAERFIISTAPTASQPPSSTSEAPARTDSHATNTCERVIENAVRYIPHSSCEQREEPSGDVICQVLDTCRGPRNYFAEADIVAICKIIYLKDELNKKIYFKLLHNLLLMDEQTCHTVLRCFLSIIHASILALTNNYVSTIKTDKFFSTLPRLCNSKKDDFPPAHLYGRLPYRHVSLDGRLDADARQHNSFFMGTISEAVNMGCVDMGIGCSSYVSCERVLEQLRSLLIALPGAMQFFGMPIAPSASDEGSSRSDSRSKRSKVSGPKSEKRSPHRHLYPIGFLFMATATKMFQSSPKLMNHLMMVIQHLVVSPETLNVHGALVAPVSLDDSSNASHVAGATPPENSDSVEMASGDEDGSAGRGDDTMNTSVDSSQTSNSHRSQDDSILRVKQDILNKLDKDAVNLFLDIHTSWCHRSNWLLSCNTMRDGSSSAHLQLVARIMSALLLSEKHASNVREFFIGRLNELIGVLCKSSLDMQAQRGEIIEADHENVILFEGVSISALEHRIAAMVRIVTFVNEMFTEVHKAETPDSSVKSNRPAMLNEFYSNVNLDRLWRALDYTLTDLVRLATQQSNSDNKDPRSSQSLNGRDVLLDNPNIVECLMMLVPLIDAFMNVTQIRVALDYKLDDVSELDNAMSFVNFDYELPDGNLDFIAVCHQERVPPKKEPWDCDETSVEISPNHLSLIYFTERQTRVLNCLIKQTPSLLSTSFSPIVRLAPNCLNFDIKRHYFRQKLKEARQGLRLDTVRINVRREHVFLDSYHQLRLRTGDEMKGKLAVTFGGEEGVDAGGLTREWFNILAKEMFNPNYGLFCREGRKQEFNHPNPLSGINPDHLNFFKFIGRVIGKAVYDGQHIDAYFCRSFYKHMLCRKITPADAESVDPEFYENLTSINNCRLEDLGLELYFSTEIDEFGKVKVIDLIPDGRNIPVTDDNKHKYIELLCRHKVTNGIKDQLDAFMSGFRELISPDLISIFDHKELELLISGTPTIDLANMRENVEYVNYNKNSKQIIWLWEFLEGLDQSNLAAFLQFVTGTSRVPIGGFKNLMGMRGPQRISIHRTCNSERLPSAHTCFNQLDLPAYNTREKLAQKMLQAILEGKEGFGFI